jgi:hypothetical protein
VEVREHLDNFSKRISTAGQISQNDLQHMMRVREPKT